MSLVDGKRFFGPNISRFRSLPIFFDAHVTDFNISFCVRIHVALVAHVRNIDGSSVLE